MKTTLKQQQKLRQETIRMLVLRLTGITEEQLSHLIFNMAVSYMKSNGMEDDWLQLFLKEPIFWTWWRQQWALVDEEFYYHYKAFLNEPKCRRDLAEIYQRMHASIDVFPDDTIYEEIHNSYNKTSQQILKKISETINNP